MLSLPLQRSSRSAVDRVVSWGSHLERIVAQHQQLWRIRVQSKRRAILPRHPIDTVTTTVLIVDDSEAMRNQLRQTLEKHRMFDEFLTANDGLEAYRKLRTNKVDLVLCDLDMPRFDGFKFLSLATADATTLEIPVILLTGHEEIENKVKGLSAGASDYLTKPFHPAELIARVRVHLDMKHLRDQLREKNRDLEVLARVDALTGVANRRWLMEALTAEFTRCQRYNRPCSLLMFDLDHFKNINDQYGHQAGDAVLISVAKVLQSALRASDTIGRYGGEEFAIILPETRCADAITVAERCLSLVRELPIGVDSQTLHVTTSVGIAGLPDDAIHNLQELVRAADDALYEAKRNGRDRLTVSKPPSQNHPSVS